MKKSPMLSMLCPNSRTSLFDNGHAGSTADGSLRSLVPTESGYTTCRIERNRDNR